MGWIELSVNGEEVGAYKLDREGAGTPVGEWVEGILSHLALDTLFVPLLVGAGVALVTGATVLGTITCCFMKRLRKQ